MNHLSRHLSFAAIIVALVLALSPPVHASDPGRWHAGVAEVQKDAARAALETGNKLITLQLFTPSVASYERGLHLWDHPGLHFNLAIALLNLNRTSDALIHLWRALQYDGAGLTRDQAHRAVRYQEIFMATEVAHVVIATPTATTIHLGERVLLTGPGRWEGVLPAGHVTLSASPSSIPLELDIVGGTKLDINWRKANPPKVTQSAQTPDTRAALMRAMIGFAFTPKGSAAADHEPPIVAPRPARDPELEALCRSATTPEAAVICLGYDTDMSQLDARFDDAAKPLRELLTRYAGAFAGGLVKTLD